ncbi:MAG: Crp/Fnr family transcriptional regulator [Myxococcota bacterium]
MPIRTLEFGVPGLYELVPDLLHPALDDAAVEVRYADGQFIQRRGDQIRGLSVLRSGDVRFGTVGFDGDQSTLIILGAGHVFGEMTCFADLPRTFDARAFGPTVVGHIEKARVDHLIAKHPELAQALLRAVSTKLHGALEFVEDLRRLPVLVHVAKLLATMARTEQPSASLEVTHSSLAQTLGITRVPVQQALETLENEGLLSRGYGRIEVPDVAALRSWVDERSALAAIK